MPIAHLLRCQEESAVESWHWVVDLLDGLLQEEELYLLGQLLEQRVRFVVRQMWWI